MVTLRFYVIKNILLFYYENIADCLDKVGNFLIISLLLLENLYMSEIFVKNIQEDIEYYFI